VSKKSPKIAALIAGCTGHPVHDPHYLGYFECFNAQLYYEAHDVLEELWLKDKHGSNGNFYKGLIQFAGAFVHLQKNRLSPASKLFNLAINNLRPYPSSHEGLSLDDLCQMARQYDQALAASAYTLNPWTSTQAPRLILYQPPRD
jgi:predicted metal-dependent hydrolase